MPVGEIVPAEESGTPARPSTDGVVDPFRPVRINSPLSQHDVDRIDRVIQYAERTSGLHFSVFLGPTGEDSRGYAIRLHAALDDPDRSVLLVVDPAAHVLEIVTGTATRRVLGDAECRIAAATMQTSFAAHDLAGGLTAGIQQLATVAYEAPTLHAGERY